MALTDDDVLQILDLIEKSDFDFLELELGDLKLIVKKRGHVERLDQRPATASVDTAQTLGAATVEVSRRQAESPAHPKPAEVDLEGFLPIRAPMVGTFYVAPEPKAAPFVKEGARVEEETPVGLIEVMKVFSSVRAGVSGTISKILVSNAQLVEYGQVLFLVKAD
jgi:acetyl-CoA carboxylase biotin carboxyl carrier protein